MSRRIRITTRNATFQQWQALLINRAKRQRAGEMLVQGVRPITLAVEYGWPVRALLYPDGQQLSSWARGLRDRVDATGVALAPELLHELSGKAAETPELLAVVELPPDRLDRVPVGAGLLAVVFDRPASPGNIGTLVRSADAFGASGVIVTGHAADPYDPQAVRASTGSLFAVPVVRVSGHQPVLDWVQELRTGGLPVTVAGTDENGLSDLPTANLTGPVVLVVGNETRGLSAAWRAASDELLRIPITGAASSLNAAAAASVVLYEAARQRSSGRAARDHPGGGHMACCLR